MSPKMKRIQIYLENDLDKNLATLAAKRGVSKAQLLRDGARRLLHDELPGEEDTIMSIVALGHSRSARVSEEHDKYLSEKKLKRSR